MEDAREREGEQSNAAGAYRDGSRGERPADPVGSGRAVAVAPTPTGSEREGRRRSCVDSVAACLPTYLVPPCEDSLLPPLLGSLLPASSFSRDRGGGVGTRTGEGGAAAGGRRKED